jgi:N-acetylglucosaminyldiphosphoundecaprenol N-acetyl-beta-D-mannosaminyltransferase
MNNLIENLQLKFTEITFLDLVKEIEQSSILRNPGYAVFCNVHSLVTAVDSELHLQALMSAKWLIADGSPVAWLLGRSGISQTRISGPDVMQAYLDRNNPNKRVYLLGGTEDACRAIIDRYAQVSPDISVVGYSCPNINNIDDVKSLFICEEINRCNPNIVWVSFGCPKQEMWCHKWAGLINAPTLAVGAAFDFLSGKKKRAPLWVQKLSLEWLFRLLHEPRRLFGRYLKTNSKFLFRLIFPL